MKWRYWVESMRLRTLPLALANTIAGSALAYADHGFRTIIFFLAAVTTLLLQILSNMANDYGDFQNGKDTEERIGPPRMVQSGNITPKAMLRGIVIVAALSVVSGGWLIYEGTKGSSVTGVVIFIVMGIAAILAAVKYTMGKNPYGYHAMGDFFVFLFFGLIGVLGTYFLHTGSFRFSLIFPAASIGMLSVGVLNLNNMRDYQSDKITGKKTVVTLLGIERARYYHAVLLSSAFILTTVYTCLNFHSSCQWLFLLSFPLIFGNLKNVMDPSRHGELNMELKRLSMASLLFALLFAVGLLI